MSKPASRRPLLGLLLLLALTGCDAPLAVLAGEPIDGKPRPVETWSGDGSTAPAASFVTARTPAEWQTLWQTVGQKPPGALPDGTMAVAVFLGPRFVAGFRAEIESAEMVTRSGVPAQPIVRWRELAPPVGQTATKAVTSPWAIQLMPASVLPPDFQKLS